jgi:hypothetical protein
MRALKFIVFLIVVAGGAAAGWWWWRVPEVRLAAATRGPAVQAVYATGVVEPVSWAKVTPLARGRIKEMCPSCEGAAVKRAAFAEIYGMLERRIGIFGNLPMASLDKLTLQKRLGEIGRDLPESA